MNNNTNNKIIVKYNVYLNVKENMLNLKMKMIKYVIINVNIIFKIIINIVYNNVLHHINIILIVKEINVYRIVQNMIIILKNMNVFNNAVINMLNQYKVIYVMMNVCTILIMILNNVHYLVHKINMKLMKKENIV